MDWISVEDKLPGGDEYEESEMVLLCDKDRDIATGFFDYEIAEWVSCLDNEHITHWMPFPEPPVVASIEV